jgi:hypothetical protein
LLKAQYETSARALASNYCTRAPNGQQQCTLPYGNQPDAEHFVKAVIKEIHGHVDNKHWVRTKRDEVPYDA